jgi:hypothetical protein
MYDQWPTGLDVRAWLTGAGLLADLPAAALAALDFEAAAQAAVSEFEHRTGYAPFLSTGVVETRYFDRPDGNRLLLRGGLLSFTGVDAEGEPETGGLTVGGQAYTAGTHYILLPQNAPALRRPYTSVRFFSHNYQDAGIYGNWGPSFSTSVSSYQLWQVAVTGVWGYGAALPADVWEGIRQKAAGLIFPQVRAAGTGLRLGYTELGVTEQFGIEVSTKFVEALHKAFDVVVAAYEHRPGPRSLRVVPAGRQ